MSDGNVCGALGSFLCDWLSKNDATLKTKTKDKFRKNIF